MSDKRTLYDEYVLALDDRDHAQGALDTCPWWRPYRRRTLAFILRVEYVRCSALRCAYAESIRRS